MTNHAKLVISAGGELLEDTFVVSSGIIITQTSEPTEKFMSLANDMNLDTENENYKVHGELNSRLTYMNFADEDPNGSLVDKITKEHQHLSIYNDFHVTVLISGLSVEACQEFVAHNEASVARLTSSNTKAQNNPLFVLDERFDYDNQIQYIKTVTTLRKSFLENDVEYNNRMFPCSKAVSALVTMSLKDWHKTFIGRISTFGVEQEVQNIMCRICSMLHDRYPLVISAPDEYYKTGNGNKYKIEN